MSKKTQLMFGLVTLAAVFAFAAATLAPGFKPKDGFVPDARTAVKIAVAVWEPIYGEQKIAEEKPFQTHLANGVWTVTGSLPADVQGGVALIEIAKNDGRILKVIHGQ